MSNRPLTPITSPNYSAPRLAEKLTQAEAFQKWLGHRVWSSSELDYETTLLAHAKLYALANCYMLSELKNMAIQRLLDTLRFIGCPHPESSVIAHITALIEYVYAHTDRLASEEEPLRKLVTTFAASNYNALEGPNLQALMSRGGDLYLTWFRSWYISSPSTRRAKKLEWINYELTRRGVNENRVGAVLQGHPTSDERWKWKAVWSFRSKTII